MENESHQPGPTLPRLNVHANVHFVHSLEGIFYALSEVMGVSNQLLGPRPSNFLSLFGIVFCIAAWSHSFTRIRRE
jgi:hypothetical protein